MNDSSFGALNLTVLFIYLIGMIAVGFIFSTRTKNKDDFLLGGRKLPWFGGRHEHVCIRHQRRNLHGPSRYRVCRKYFPHRRFSSQPSCGTPYLKTLLSSISCTASNHLL